MTEQNILVYKLFLSLNIPDSSFFIQKLQPLKKVIPSFPANPLKKLRFYQAPPSFFFENLVGGSTPPSKKKGGARYNFFFKS